MLLLRLLTSLKMAYKLTLITVILALFASCSHREKPTPKPRGYFRIDLPEKSYQKTEVDCPFSFEYPEYSKLVQKGEEICWYNLEFTSLNATVHLSYKKIDDNLDQYMEDSRKLVYDHSIKADAINEQFYSDSLRNIFSVRYDIEGNAASSLQFFVTDSTDHFVRGSLYFNSVPNKDSIKPVLSFVKTDINHLIETFEFKN